MGLKPLPYLCMQDFVFAEDIIKGDWSCPKNDLHWDYIILDLPGDTAYETMTSQVYKYNKLVKGMANNFVFIAMTSFLWQMVR
eukprot:9492214-Ditylum_brightwellii.AAC.1